METKKIDIFVIAVTLIMYITINVFSVFSKQYYFENLIMLSLTSVLILLAYFTDIILGLSASAVVIFFYGSYILYGNVIKGKAVDYHVYFWIIIMPLLTTLWAIIGSKIRDIQRENEKLNNEYSLYVTVDPKTGLGNVQVFFNVINQYMNLSRRHKLPLTLLLVRIMYFDDIKNILGHDAMEAVLKQIGEKLVESTRIEDCSYILEDGRTFALLLFTDIKGAEIVKSRIKENTKNYNLSSSGKSLNLNIELKIGMAQYREEISGGALGFRKAAEKDMEYDV